MHIQEWEEGKGSGKDHCEQEVWPESEIPLGEFAASVTSPSALCEQLANKEEVVSWPTSVFPQGLAFDPGLCQGGGYGWFREDPTLGLFSRIYLEECGTATPELKGELYVQNRRK